MRLVSRLSPLAVALVLFSACSDDKPTPPPQTPTVAVSAATTTATVARGGTATYPITITRGGGFTGAVTLAAVGLPADVVASFTPTSLPNGTTTSTLTLTAGANAAAATTNFTVQASGSGVTTASVPLSITVSPPAASITLTAGATTGTVAQGATTTIPINITRTNFTGDVAIAVTGLPTGVTFSLNPVSPLGAGVNATTLTLTAAPTATVTTAPTNITITASGTGVTAQTATVGLSVTASATPGFTLTPSAATVTAIAGAAGTSTFTLARQGGFTGDVGLTVTGAPAGVTATLTPASLTGTTLTSTLNIATTAAAVPGTYTLNVVGASTGQTNRTVPITLTISAAPGIAVVLTPATLSLAAGATATSNLAVTRVGGLTGDVALTATGAPAGLTVAFAPATVTGTNTTSGITVTAAANTAPGTYNIVVRGAGANNVAGTSTLAVTVTAAQSITAAATNVTVAPGATGTSNVTLTRAGGFEGAVGLTVTGLPAGVTATFNPASVTGTGTTSALSLAVGAGVAPGTYTGTITAAGTGVTSATGTFTLTVPGGPGGGGIVSFQFCGDDIIPVFLAYRNGTSGAWIPVTVGANRTYSISFTGSIGQVAYADANTNGGVDMSVIYSTVAELQTFANLGCIQDPATKSVSGTVAGLGMLQTATVSLGSGSASVQTNGGFTITNANAAAADLLATRTTINTTTGSLAIDKLILRRNVNAPAGGSVGGVLDFNSAEAVNPATAQYTIGNVGGETLTAFTAFQTANGGSGSFFNLGASTPNPLTVIGVPSNLTQAGDFHSVTVFATPAGTTQTNARAVIQYNRDLSNRTVNLGAMLTAPTLTTLATAPYARIRAAGPWQADYADYVAANYTQESGRRSWSIIASRGYFGGANSYELDIPDLSGVAGFQNTWGLLPGVATEYSLTAFTGLQGLSTVVEGGTFRFGVRSGTYTP